MTGKWIQGPARRSGHGRVVVPSLPCPSLVPLEEDS